MPVESVLARNLMGGVTVLSSDPRSTHFVEWAAAGDPSGNDVQLVPEEIIKTVPFARAIQRGVLAIENVEDNPEIQAMLDRQTKAWKVRQESAQQDIRATIDSQPNRDMVTLNCLGPSDKGTGNCSAEVPVREISKHDAPPLCHRHINLASEFVPTNEGLDTDATQAKQTVRWVRAAINPTPIGLQV